MERTFGDLIESTTYGELYIVKKVLYGGTLLRLSKLVNKNNNLMECGRIIHKHPPIWSGGIRPEEGDMMYRCDGDKCVSLVKRRGDRYAQIRHDERDSCRMRM